MVKLAVASLLLLAALAAPTLSTPVETSAAPAVVIDGTDTTIALAATKNIDPKFIIAKLIDLVKAIIKALNAPKFDYWGNVKADVELVVGSYINNHSISQVEHFQKDLQTLLLRYTNAPTNSSSYADKDHQAAALNMAILAHRYIVMSGDLKFSLLLHFEDIAAMHLSVLQDAAQTYSTDSKKSQWYVDLNEALETYMTYAKNTTAELNTFRMNAIKCVTKECDSDKSIEDESNENDVSRSCYDVYDIYDYVTGHKDECKQLPGRTDCVNTCSDYKTHIQQQVDKFIADKVTPVLNSWENLHNVTKNIAPKATKFFNPIKYSTYFF